MSLYCTNIDVYFDNKDVYNSKCVEGHDMHNDNLRLQDSGKSDLRERAVFTLNWDSEQYFTSGADGMCFTFFHYKDGVYCLVCQRLLLAFVPTFS